jgi:hypothetical protein
MPNGRPYEDRPNWAALFRRKKTESWMSDYSGIVVFAEDPGRKFWVNTWRNEDKESGEVFLSLSVKEKSDAKTRAHRCDLHHVRGGRHYSGELELGDVTYRVRIFRAATRARHEIYLQVQFDPVASPALAGRKGEPR